MPAVLGPITWAPRSRAAASTYMVSCTGTCSVRHTILPMPAPIASSAASFTPNGGMNITAASMAVSRAASRGGGPHRQVEMRLAGALGVDAADDARAVVAHALRPERALLAGDALHQHGLAAAQDHARPPCAAATAALTASSIRSNGSMPSRSFTMAIASSSFVPWMVKKIGIVRLQRLPGLDHALGHDVGAGERAAEIDEQAFHARIGEHQLQRRRGLGVALAADLHEVGRAPPP